MPCFRRKGRNSSSVISPRRSWPMRASKIAISSAMASGLCRRSMLIDDSAAGCDIAYSTKAKGPLDLLGEWASELGSNFALRKILPRARHDGHTTTRAHAYGRGVDVSLVRYNQNLLPVLSASIRHLGRKLYRLHIALSSLPSPT